MGVFSATVPKGSLYFAGNANAGGSAFPNRLQPDITTRHVIRYKGVLYDITRVDVFEGYKGDLTLYCKRQS